MNHDGSYDAESSVSIATLGDDEMAHSMAVSFISDREYRLALWVARRWRYHQMTSLRVRQPTIRALVGFFRTGMGMGRETKLSFCDGI